MVYKPETKKSFLISKKINCRILQQEMAKSDLKSNCLEMFQEGFPDQFPGVETGQKAHCIVPLLSSTIRNSTKDNNFLENVKFGDSVSLTCTKMQGK